MGKDPIATFLCCVLAVGIVVGLSVLASKRSSRSDEIVSDDPAHQGGGVHIDAGRPDLLGESARHAFDESDFLRSFDLYVKAVDSLDDLYGYDQFRQRQPSPADAWIVDGMTRALGLARRHDPDADIREGVEIATGRLRRIARLTEAAGGNSVLYRQALVRLTELAPDIDVSEIDP